jgi:hypothetical protein
MLAALRALTRLLAAGPDEVLHFATLLLNDCDRSDDCEY